MIDALRMFVVEVLLRLVTLIVPNKTDDGILLVDALITYYARRLH